MADKETVYDSEVIGDQIGYSVRRLMRSGLVNKLIDYSHLTPEWVSKAEKNQVLAINLVGDFYLKHWGHRRGRTAVMFSSLGQSYWVGNHNETDPLKIIHWSALAAWAYRNRGDNHNPNRFEAVIIASCDQAIKRAEEKIIRDTSEAVTEKK